jgi:hypothetical protein
VYVEVVPNPQDANQCLNLEMNFIADSTGQPGVAFGDVPQFLVNKGLVENGANGTPNGYSCVCGGNPGRGFFGYDCFLKSNLNEVTSFVSRCVRSILLFLFSFFDSFSFFLSSFFAFLNELFSFCYVFPTRPFSLPVRLIRQEIHCADFHFERCRHAVHTARVWTGGERACRRPFRRPDLLPGGLFAHW